MNGPKAGQLSVCAVCGHTIRFGGERWHHADGKTYRHTPEPEFTPAPAAPPGTSYAIISAFGPGCVVEDH